MNFVPALAIMTCFISVVAAWFTHVGVMIGRCLEPTVTIGDVVLLILGTLAAPIGVVHGFGIWLGIW